MKHLFIKVYILFFSLLSITAFSQTSLGIKTDVNGFPLNGMAMDFNFAPKKKLILQTKVQEFAKGKIRLKDEKELTGYVKNINGNFHFKQNVDDIDIKVINGRQINTVTIGEDSTNIVYSAYINGKMTKRKYAILYRKHHGEYAFGDQIVNKSDGKVEELFFYKGKKDNYWSTYNTAVLEDVFINDSIYTPLEITLLKQKKYNFIKGIVTFNNHKKDTVFYYITNKAIKYKKYLTSEFETELIPQNFKTLVSVQDSIFTTKSILEKGQKIKYPLVLSYKYRINNDKEYAQNIGVTRPNNYVYNNEHGLWEKVEEYPEVNEETLFTYHQRSTFWSRMIKSLVTYTMEDKAITNQDSSTYHGIVSTFEFRNNNVKFSAKKMHRFFQLKKYYDHFLDQQPLYYTNTWHPVSEKTNYKGIVTSFDNDFFTITYYKNNQKLADINYHSSIDKMYVKSLNSSFYTNGKRFAQYQYDLEGNMKHYNIFYPGTKNIFYSYHITQILIRMYNKNFYYPTFETINDPNGQPINFNNEEFTINDPYTNKEAKITFSNEKLIFLSRMENNQKIYSYTDQVQDYDFSPMQKIINKYVLDHPSALQESIDNNYNGHYYLSMILNEKGRIDKIDIIGDIHKDVDKVVNDLSLLIQKKVRLTPYLIHQEPVKVELIIPLITDLKNRYTLHNHSVAKPDMNYIFEHKESIPISEYIDFFDEEL